MGVRSFQTMVPMRDGARLNTFVFLPESGGPRFPVILHRTHYGIVAADGRDKFDHTNAWLPSAVEPMRAVPSCAAGGNIVARGYVAVYQDCRGRHGSEGEDRVYADDAADGYDTLDCIGTALGIGAVQLPVAGVGNDPRLRGVGGRADPGPASRFRDRCRFEPLHPVARDLAPPPLSDPSAAAGVGPPRGFDGSADRGEEPAERRNRT
jgi:hypothetical protein